MRPFLPSHGASSFEVFFGGIWKPRRLVSGFAGSPFLMRTRRCSLHGAQVQAGGWSAYQFVRLIVPNLTSAFARVREPAQMIPAWTLFRQPNDLVVLFA